MTDEGWRADAGSLALVHDVDGRHVVLDFPTDGLTPDNYRTAWSPHVFAASFQANPRVPYLLNHDPSQIIGSAVRAESLADRARVVNRFASTPRADEVHALIREGHLPGASFHFRNGLAEAVPGLRGVKRYVKADFLESSSVTFPAIKGAGVAGIRSDDPRDVDRLAEMARAWAKLSDRERRRRLAGAPDPEVVRSVAESWANRRRASREVQDAMPDADVALADLRAVFARHGFDW